jgi:hypothetical protein
MGFWKLMKIDYFNTFIEETTRKTLFDFAVNMQNDFVKTSNKDRKISGALVLPKEAISIQKELINLYSKICPITPMSYWHKGIMCSIMEPKSEMPVHLDSNYKKDGLSVVGFNLLVSESNVENNVTVEDQKYIMKTGDMMAYLISDYYHGVSPIGNVPRVMWYWRFYVDKKTWENR